VVLVSDECRIQKESGITSIWFPQGKYPEIKVEQVKQALSFYGALDVKTGREKISVAFFKRLHFICFEGTKTFAGKLRDVEVVIRDSQGNVMHQGAPYKDVEKLLKYLCAWYEKHNKKYPPLVLAAVMHNEFEKIHPFQDGNGRVGRL